MSLATKWKQREQTCGYQWKGGREGLEVWDEQRKTVIYMMAKQQGPTAQHKELYSISCDKAKWKIINIVYICMCV